MTRCSDVADGGDSLHDTACDCFVLLYPKGCVVCDILTAVLWKMEKSSLLRYDAVSILQAVADV